MGFVRDVLIVVAALSVGAAAVFRTVDPRGDFRTGLFPVVVRDTRVEKMRLFSNRASRPIQGLVLGSSRSMKLSPAILRERTGLEFFNFAVENARAEDYLAIARWVRQQGARPRLLIVGLDVEALHDNDVPEDQLLANEELERALTGTDDGWQRLRTYKRAFAPTYFTDTLKSLRGWVRPTQRSPYLLEPDGLLRDRETERQRASGSFDFSRGLGQCLDVYVARFQDMTALSPTRKRDLEQLIAEEQAAGGRTILWITPLHPATVGRLMARTSYGELLRQTEAYLEEVRTGRPVITWDFSEPRRYGGTLTEWDDCAHTDEAESDRIARALIPH